jgi:ATP-dependent exoDNAse (exonuclease V) alpha subunit
MQLTPTQQNAVDQVLAWLTNKEEREAAVGYGGQVFRLFGFAGSGKTTIAKFIAEKVRELDPSREVRFAAYTGKAASVMQAKGCIPASTVHGLIYKPVGEDEKGDPIFRKQNRPLDVHLDQLVILDECSMINREMGKDLLSFGVPVLVLGDPAQLPPVGGAGYFTDCEPDILLTEIHRQAADSGILTIATTIRTGGRVKTGDYGDAHVLTKRDLSMIDLNSYDQVLVGTNATRTRWNQRMRGELGFTSEMPEPGDKLINLRNNYVHHIMNGEMVTVIDIDEPRGNPDEEGEGVSMEVELNGKRFRCWCDTHYLRGRAGKPPYGGQNELFFDFGYAITVHKSQGSQWGSVFVFDESQVFRQDAARWLYTGVTRAADNLTLMRGGF